ncbi:NAD(P)-dependent dehydrogenase (short-subunit alcohol dehydrogenase family) [Catenuloplanes nepalensis]|uniref:NAD(P)-dependent dehydrogenase (Short-subunit alcohol dehydrogenase family) n=1 Tax=Catenuloplanes nepalensis TaxID=587533 RepID=A0ABT9MSF3_9ACTN|nr:SDR family NAD(P)-dependent oxidoreductase [Catenuloplanes nepalensis]MDP9794299.1 NAD(P)-dependent dehydrogenase (short-subunit alcohol dehydrogenase family) [Catenuloplanes nepalensis]
MTTVLITGGHSGIGLAAATELAARKVDLILAGRSPDRMRAVADDLRAAHGVSVTTVALDLCSLASVREAATRVPATQLDALLCNAGGRFEGDVTFSPDGYETTFAANCLGHFLLVELLLPQLAENARVIYTASGTHDRDTTDGRMVGAAAEPDAEALATNATALSAGKRYSTSKLCTVMYAYELHRRLRKAGSTVSSIAYDPGSVPGTGFLRGMPRPVQLFSTTRAMNWLSRRLGVTVSDVAFSGASLATLAADPEYADASGKYFQAKQGKLSAVRSAKLSYDERRAAKLWDDSRRLARLTPDEEPAQLR